MPSAARADTGFTHPGGSDNLTHHGTIRDMPDLPGISDNFTRHPVDRISKESTDSPDGRRMGATYLPVVYVNDKIGNDSYDGSYPTVLGGGIGPKKTIQAGIDICEWDARDMWRQGLPREYHIEDCIY